MYRAVMMGACLLALSVQGCRNYGAEVEKIVAERDSLQRSLERQSAEFENYEQTVGTLNAALDSITALENLIFSMPENLQSRGKQ